MAKQVRAGLEQSPIEGALNERARLALVSSRSGGNRDPLDELWFGKTIRRHIFEFAEVFALIMLIIAAGGAYKGRPLWVVGVWTVAAVCLVLVGKQAPAVLHPLWKGWMKVAMVLSTIMTFVILSVLWTLVLMPIAFILKAIGKHVMDVRYSAPVTTYWEDRDPKHDDFKLLERQF